MTKVLMLFKKLISCFHKKISMKKDNSIIEKMNMIPKRAQPFLYEVMKNIGTIDHNGKATDINELNKLFINESSAICFYYMLNNMGLLEYYCFDLPVKLSETGMLIFKELENIYEK